MTTVPPPGARLFELTPVRVCAWCRGPIEDDQRADAIYCGVRCRQSSWRFGVPPSGEASTEDPQVFGYADPPYPGKAHLYPENTEIDHASLVDALRLNYPAGWALSTSSDALPQVLAVCPAGVRIAAWVKHPRRSVSYRPHLTWEPVVFAGGRPLPVTDATHGQTVHGVDDSLVYQGRYRAFPGALIGMKPPQFAEWMFRQLGAGPGDEFDDLFPGSGAVAEAWRRYSATPEPPPHQAKRIRRVRSSIAGVVDP